MDYFSIDCETGGLDPVYNSLLEIGLVAASTTRPDGETFRIGVLPTPSGIWNLTPYAASMNATLIQDIVAKKGFDTIVTPDVVAGAIFGWFKKLGLQLEADGKFHINVAGKNFSGFDKLFLKHHCWNLDQVLQIRHRVLDPGSMYVTNEDRVVPALKECCVRAGIDLSTRKLHTAIDDALLVSELIYIALNRKE